METVIYNKKLNVTSTENIMSQDNLSSCSALDTSRTHQQCQMHPSLPHSIKKKKKINNIKTLHSGRKKYRKSRRGIITLTKLISATFTQAAHFRVFYQPSNS